ncbi:MAG: tripartite tricarboxylate transporter substrate binding protein [Noviherbaspirillum sp.]
MHTPSSVIIAGLLALAAAAPACAEYPDRPIRMLVGYTPGGGADNLIRPVSERLAKLLGKPVVMDYRPGAGGSIAAEMLARSPADGYTLHITDSGPMTILPNMRKMPYSPQTDFTMLAMLGSGGTVILTPPNSQATDIPKLVSLIKQNPSAWSYGTSGVGGVGHLAGEQFKIATGLTALTHIPYKGGAPALAELMGNHVPVLFSSLGSAAAHISGGRVKPLAVTSAKRSSILPDTPTLAELGYPGFDASIWFGIVGPRGMPPEVMDRLLPALRTALQDPAVQESIRKEGYEPVQMTPEQMRAQVNEDLARWGKTIKEAGVKME